MWIFGQNNSVGGGDPFRPYRTECTECQNCGVQIPAGYVGYDFDIPNDYAPATSALNLYLHLFYLNTTAYYYPPATSSPTTPIVLAGNQSTIQTFINSCLVAEGFNANDIILIVNSDNTVTVWHSPSYTPNGNEFWMGTIVPDDWTNKYYPSIPTTHPTNGNTRALLVKECKTQSDISVPNCDGTNTIQSVDQVTGTYILNQENKHTEKIYDVLTAVFGGTIAYTYNAPLEVVLSYSAVTIANDTVSFYWTDFGDGYNDVGSNPSHAYNADGSYEIKSYGITLSGNKILLMAKEVNIFNGVISYAPTNLPQPVSATYQVLVTSAFQDYCGSLLVGSPYNADGTPYTLIGDFVTERPIIIDELEDNADYQVSTLTPTVQRRHENFVVTGSAPLVIPAGAISISVTKTNNTGVVNISGDNATAFPLTFNRENFTDSVNEAVSTLSAYTTTGTLAGTTYKVHIIR